MHLRSTLNRLLYTVVPGLGQLLDGHYFTGTLVAAAAVATIYLAEASNSEYRRLQTEYRKLNLPSSFHGAVADDRHRCVAALACLYLGLGLISASLYHEDPHDDFHDDFHDDEPHDAEEP